MKKLLLRGSGQKNMLKEGFEHSDSYRSWRSVEWILLFLFLLCRLYILVRFWNVENGFDTSRHLEMIRSISWSHPTVGVTEIFYGYHPPLGFLFARFFMALNIPIIASAQMVSALASVIAFLFLRRLLLLLDLLREPMGIIFLYTTCSLPLHIFLIKTINLDTIIFACAILALYSSIQLVWKSEHFVTYSFVLAFALTVAIFTKFTGIMLFSIPLFVMITFRLKSKIHYERYAACAIACACALIIAFPYYFTRYYQPFGSFFPHNEDYFAPEMVARARAVRDADRLQLFIDLFKRSPAQRSESVIVRDQEKVRLFDTWRDFWVKERYFGSPSTFSLRVATYYVYGMPFLLLLGFLSFIWYSFRKDSVWYKLGDVLFSVCIIQFLGLLYHIYNDPTSIFYPGKAIYIVPATMGIGFLIACPLLMTQAFSDSFAHVRTKIEYAALTLTCIFIVFNHLSSLS
jgi:hypothetical protein